MVANCPVSAGSVRATSCGSTTWRTVCARVKPTARAASSWLSSMDSRLPRTISAM